MATRAVQTVVSYTAWDTLAQAGKTGDVANHTLRWLKDGVAAAPTNAAAEIDSTNLPGEYKVTLTSTETDCLFGEIGGKSSTANIIIVPTRIAFEAVPNAAAGASGGLPTVDANNAVKVQSGTGANQISLSSGAVALQADQAVNVTKVNGTAQTARDLGAQLDAAVSSRSSHSAADVWSVGTRTLTSFGTLVADVTSAVWSATTRVLTAGTNIALAKGTGVTGFNDLDAAGVRTAIGMASANLDTQIASLLASSSYTAPDNASIAAIKAKTDNLPSAPADEGLIIAATDALASSIAALPSANANADALLDRADGIETGWSLRQALRIIFSVLAGKANGLSGTTVTFRDVNDSKTRVTATVDSVGDRSALTLDAS